MDYNSYEQGRQQGRQESNNGDGGAGAILLSILGALILIWFCLYPLSAVAAGAAWLSLHHLLELPAGNFEGFNRVLVAEILPAAGALAILWTTSRLDHRLATRPIYRVVRHLIRITLMALMAGVIHLWIQDDITPLDLFRLYGPRLASSPVRVAEDFLALLEMDPLRPGIMTLTGILSHFWIWSWQGGRRGWLECLQALRLRPANLPAAP